MIMIQTLQYREKKLGRIAFAEGIEQGIERGFEQGSYQKALETATAFKKLGFDIAKIAEGTGLSLKEVEAL